MRRKSRKSLVYVFKIIIKSLPGLFIKPYINTTRPKWYRKVKNTEM